MICIFSQQTVLLIQRVLILLQRAGSPKLETTSTGIDVSGRLDVAQDIRLRGNSSTSDVGVASISIADANGSINFDAGNDGSNMTLTSTGLDVSGNIEVGDSHLIGDDSFDNLALVSGSGENIVVGANNDIYFTTGATNLTSTGNTKLIVKNGGNIGISTTDPQKPLHVYNATIDYVARFESGG